jgi:general stress protein YciG
MANDNTGRRGFANMDEDEQREIARKGGQSSRSGGQDSENR